MLEDYKNKIIHFYKKENRMPTYTEAMKLFGFKSKNAVSKVFEKCIDAGLVIKDHLGRLKPAKAFGDIPLLGTIKAGLPSEALDIGYETININEFLVERQESTYMLEVDGDSMIDAHIEDGDIVIAQVSSKARIGEIVIANTDGEWTMKYYREKNGKPYLEAANKNYKPIYPKESFYIGAIVKGVIRKY